MTHYYSFLLFFFGILAMVVYWFCKKKVKQGVIVGCIAVIAVAIVFVSYPSIITQATGSSTNNIGNEVVNNLFNIPLFFNMTVSLAKQYVAQLGYYSTAILIVILMGTLLLIAGVILAIKNKKVKDLVDFETIWLLIVFICVFLSICFVGGEYVYIRYTYFIAPIPYIIFAVLIERFVPAGVSVKKIAVGTCIIATIVGAGKAVDDYSTDYLFITQATRISELNGYFQEKLIVVSDDMQSIRSTAIPTGNFMCFREFESVYMDSLGSLIDDDIIKEELKDGEIVLYIPTDTYWIAGYEPEEVFSQMKESDCEVFYEKICDGSLGEFYRVRLVE